MFNLGKKILIYGICSMLGSPFIVVPNIVYASSFSSDLTMYEGGTIYTMQESVEEVQKNIVPKKAEVVIVKDDRIIYVGNKKIQKK